MSSEESAGEVDENDLELIDRGEVIEEPENLVEGIEEPSEQNVEGETQDEAEDKKTVKPKRIIKNPQPKLNERTLQEKRGLAALPGHFDRVKFRGRGYEDQDLNVLMKTYEYWCHRMIPKFTFNDCIARLETLGSKKATQTQIKRIRMGIDLDNNDEVVSENEDGAAGSADEANAQFDQLITNNSDSLPTTTPDLSEEQLEKIRQNKERAQRLREEKLRAIREKAQNNLQTSELLSRQNSQSSSSIVDPDICISSTSSNNQTAYEEHQGNNLEFNRESDKVNGVDDNEDNIDNILDFINTDEPTSKLLTPALETDDKQKSPEASAKNRTLRRRIVESDEESEDDNQTTHNMNNRKIIDSDDEEENMDIDNILTEINAADKTMSKSNESKTDDEPMGLSMGKVNTDLIISNDVNRTCSITTENGDLSRIVLDKDNLENNLNRANMTDTEVEDASDLQKNTGYSENTIPNSQTEEPRLTEGLEVHLKEASTVGNSKNVVFDNQASTQDTTYIQQVETGNNTSEAMDTTS